MNAATEAMVPVRFVADYQMMGDMEGMAWAEKIFSHAKETGKILDYKVLNSSLGTWGIQFVSFTIDALIPDGSQEKAKEAGEFLLNSIVGDSDVEVRWVSPLLDDANSFLVIFDDSNLNWTRDEVANRLFIKGITNYLNQKLDARGHVLLNDVFDAIACKRTPAGTQYGWLRGSHVRITVKPLGGARLELKIDVDGLIWDKI